MRKEENRHRLAMIYHECLLKAKNPSLVRKIWNEEVKLQKNDDLPSIIGDDAFLRMYAEGVELPLSILDAILKRVEMIEKEEISFENPIFVGSTLASKFYDVKAVPPGVCPKFFSKVRKKNDPLLLAHVQSDLEQLLSIEDDEKRKWLTLALLSHGAAYRELEGKVLKIPSLNGKKELIAYGFHQHLIWEGVKTISANPLESEESERGIYICQGTEIWPSQSLTLGSIFANLNVQGSATEPYAYAWKQIHKHLRALKKSNPDPIVIGHSMGGALAVQIALYSHPFIHEAYAFNPPVVEKRDFEVYHKLTQKTQLKLFIFANIDDLPFWRIGSKVIGKVYLLLGEKRWKYYPVKVRDFTLIIPALVKTIVNLIHLVPAHQNIILLMRSYVVVPLSLEEIERENEERVKRRDHISFFPRMHRFVGFVLSWRRKHFRWEMSREYLLSQIEIVELHEQDLEATSTMLPRPEIERQLKELKRQKDQLEEKLQSLEKRRRFF